MKRNLQYALLASAAVFALGIATPSQAQQDTRQAPAATSQQGAYQATERYSAMRDDDAAAGGYEAYGYVPGGAAGDRQGCAIEGTYGKGLDYSACGGGD